MLLNVLDARDRPTQDSFFSEELMGDAETQSAPRAAPTPIGCVTLGKSLHCSERQVSRLSSGASMCPARVPGYPSRSGSHVLEVVCNYTRVHVEGIIAGTVSTP